MRRWVIIKKPKCNITTEIILDILELFNEEEFLDIMKYKVFLEELVKHRIASTGIFSQYLIDLEG
jgi:hypothetical protein